MKMKQAVMGIFCGCMFASGVLTAQAVNTPEPATAWNGVFYAEDRFVFTFTNTQMAETNQLGCIIKNADDIQLPVILYQGSTYFPLRTAGELTGKNVDWDAETKTASLSGTAEKVYHTEAKESMIPKDMKLSVIQDKEIKISIDGKETPLKDASGNVIYPIIYADTTYVPLRSVSELTGLEVKWTKNDIDEECIFMRTPLTDAQKTEADTYIKTQAERLQAISDAATALQDEDTLTEEVRTETFTNILAQLDKMEQESLPTAPLFTKTNAVLQDALQQLQSTIQQLQTAPLEEIQTAMIRGTWQGKEIDISIPLIQMQKVLEQTSDIKGTLAAWML